MKGGRVVEPQTYFYATHRQRRTLKLLLPPPPTLFIDLLQLPTAVEMRSMHSFPLRNTMQMHCWSHLLSSCPDFLEDFPASAKPKNVPYFFDVRGTNIWRSVASSIIRWTSSKAFKIDLALRFFSFHKFHTHWHWTVNTSSTTTPPPHVRFLIFVVFLVLRFRSGPRCPVPCQILFYYVLLMPCFAL